MKIKLLSILLVLLTLTFVACDEDTVTEAVLGTNSVTLSGAISKSFDAETLAGLSQEDTLSVFSINMAPEGTENYDSDILTVVKQSETLPAVGEYDISLDFENTSTFIATYFASDTEFYMMTSGKVVITESGSSKIAGTIDVSGVNFMDSTKTLNISAKFSTVPVDLN